MAARITITVPAIQGKVLGVAVYRGFARLSDLAKLSDADVYDREKNPTGTQRDLSPKHAKEAYEYITNSDPGFWPEIVLCARDGSSLSFSSDANSKPCGTLTVSVPAKRKSVSISRVDGNHRLYYAAGDAEGYKPVNKPVSFCIVQGLSLEQEIQLFRDINANQRAMNTSHLDNIKTRLSGEDALKVEDRELYIAKQLGSDSKSPLNGRVYEGGKKPAGFIIPLRGLKTGIQYMLSRQSKLLSLRDPDAQYKVIRNYFSALKKWMPSAFDEPKKFLLLRGAGLWGVCFLGTEVIDRALAQGKFGTEEMLEILKSGRKWDWSNNGDFSGFSGRGGALKISQQIASELKDASGVSARQLYKQIMDMK
jgi:DGQHR domain-containing protein